MSFGRSQAKLAMRLALMVVVAMFGILTVTLLSRAMTDIVRSEETAAIFNVSAELDHDLIEAVEWLPDVANLPKELAPRDREDLTDTWLRAWAQFLILSDGSGPVGSSVEGEVTDGIAEYFDGSAADAMLVGADDWLGLPVHQIGHDLRLTFYSDDGAVVSVTSESSRFLRGQPVGDEIEWYDTTESYDAVFVFQDGNWRIHHWVRRSAEGSWANALNDTPPVPFDVDDMRAITWRPATQTLEEFWTDPDLTTAEAEFALLRPLGFNTVRIELPFEELGGRDVAQAQLFAATALLDLAKENGLSVSFSLLHGRTTHQPLHWDADDDHLDDVVGTLGSHPALVLWELAAQPDLHLGIERVDNKMLTAWLVHITRTVKAADGDTPLTIGWSSARAAAEAPPIADVVSFAWSGDVATMATDLDFVRSVSDGRPILISDATYHTSLGLLPGGQTETEQARFFADMLIAVDEFSLDGFSISTLRDFDVETVAARAQDTAERLHAEEKERIAEQELRFPPPVTPEPEEAGPEVVEAPIIAEVTWPTGAEASAGLIRVDGTAKPAAGVFAPDTDLHAVPSPSVLETIRKPFNLGLAILIAVALSGWLFLALWARNKLPIPQRQRLKTDEKGAQQRPERNRKKGSVAAPIEPQPAAEPKASVFRRVAIWLNAPVLPKTAPETPAGTTAEGASVIQSASVADRAVETPSVPVSTDDVQAETLADALPSWPSENMLYSDVHSALIGEGIVAPGATAMSIVEVDLQAIDAVIGQDNVPDIASGAVRYAPFLMRALCMAADDFNDNNDVVHISVHGAGIDGRCIKNAHDKRLSAFTRELANDVTTGDEPAPTVAINLSSSIGGHLSVEIGDGQIPTVSLVYLSKRPIATSDRLGCAAITTHSMGLLSVAVSTTPTRADLYLDRVREILEARDWTTEVG